MPFELFELDGEVALVTGASRGIGLAAATALAEAGSDVVLCSRNLTALQDVSKKILSLDRKVLPIPVDVSDRSQVLRMTKQVISHFGKIDILVNCAGTIALKPAIDWNDEEWHQVIDVNLKGTFLCCQEIARHMIDRAQGGKIINTASLLSTIGSPNIIGYASSKGGVASLTRSLAVEWAKYGINVNAIGPGYIRTELTHALQEDRDRSAEVVSRIPLRRWGNPDDLKGAFVFLASAASDYVTGQIIWVDGGRTAT